MGDLSWLDIGERIRTAREALGRSQADVARAIGVDRTALVRMEAGQRNVSAVELFKLADEFDVTPGYFLRRPYATTLSRRSPVPDQRPLDGDPAGGEAAWRISTALDEHIHDLEMLRGQGYLTASATLVPPRQVGTALAATALAIEARRALGQPQGPLGALADTCERFGLYLLVADLRMDGASALLDQGPSSLGAAVVGGQAEPGRRRWTAAHELGHHLLADEYHTDVGVAASRDQRERVIDAFAGEILLPAADAEHAVHPVRTAARSVVRDCLIGLAGSYRMSWGAVLNRVDALDLLPPRMLRELRAELPVRGDLLRVLGAEPQEDLVIGTTGPRWRQAVLRCYQDSLITPERAIELLHGALAMDDLPDLPDDDQSP